ncbi:hypothetical protein DAEQUDRAFT_694991 [Daedalea quercina L-15889]|uniref:Chromatin modification-related protein n=1 Tax=Daedalea quercina L-15889 TaxID=1314783 RepID=A0A165ND35_9APHY|nr:hypothetical protein DAEQUDRAFT_694991 [Daedalea quercina L-15889]
MSILTRKRRRSEAFQEEEEPRHERTDAEGQPIEDAQDDSEGSVAGDVPDERAKKEREVWDAFREEQYEVLEQLPLSLHRSFALMLELDQQVQENEKTLVPTLRDYVSVRKKLADDSAPKERNNFSADHESDGQGLPSDVQMNGPELSPMVAQQEDLATLTPAEELPASSRQLLTKIANLSEEIVRASNEKVNVARFAYDLVDRYIRDLDRAIKEQETSLSLGLRPGTHPASIILPEIVPPTTTRAARVTQPPPESITVREVTPAPSTGPVPASATLQVEKQDIEEDEPTLGVESSETPEHGGRRTILIRPRKRRGKKWSKQKRAATSGDAADQGDTATSEGTASLKLTVPPLSSITAQVGNTPGGTGDMSELGALGDMPIDPNEPLYCYCNQVSYGAMVACDNDSCEREWFHLGCVGLKEPPSSKAKWYCRDCAEKMGQKKKGR